MTTITLPRAVVEQALEALDAIREADMAGATPKMVMKARSMYEPAITALRDALAEPVQPVAKVELMTTGGNAGLATRIVEIDDHLRERLLPGQLLYTAPPQRKPLTEEEIIDVVRDADLDWAKGWTLDEMQGNRFATLARAIERAHGIGGQE